MKLTCCLSTLLSVVVALIHISKALSDECPRRDMKILNGYESVPDPATLMVASSEKSRRYTALQGLAFGSTGWSPKLLRKGEWLEADFGSWAYVSQVRVYLLTPGVKVKVEAGTDPADWEEASQVSRSGGVIKAEFDPPVLSQYVRVTVTDFWNDIELEMMAIGCPTRKEVAEENLLY